MVTRGGRSVKAGLPPERRPFLAALLGDRVGPQPEVPITRRQALAHLSIVVSTIALALVAGVGGGIVGNTNPPLLNMSGLSSPVRRHHRPHAGPALTRAK
jgi:hypothetical protein